MNKIVIPKQVLNYLYETLTNTFTLRNFTNNTLYSIKPHKFTSNIKLKENIKQYLISAIRKGFASSAYEYMVSEEKMKQLTIENMGTSICVINIMKELHMSTGANREHSYNRRTKEFTKVAEIYDFEFFLTKLTRKLFKKYGINNVKIYSLDIVNKRV
jgi:hypothetical protein